jgi:hypothetical protein
MTITSRTQFPQLIDEMGLKVGAEVGVRVGAFSAHLLANSKLDLLHSIDPWTDDDTMTMAYTARMFKKNGRMQAFYEEAMDRLAKFGDRSRVVRKTSLEAVEGFKDGELDFLYLDASHLFTGFAMDMIRWWPKVRDGGVMAGHDYIRKSTYQVAYVVNGFCMEHLQRLMLTVEDTDTDGRPAPSWWFVKEPKINRGRWMGRFASPDNPLIGQARALAPTTRVDIPYELLDIAAAANPGGPR